MAKNQNTIEKQRRETIKKQKAQEKQLKRKLRKQESNNNNVDRSGDSPGDD